MGLSLRESAGGSQLPVSQQLQTSRLPSTGTQLEEDGSTVTGELGPPATPLPPLCPKDPKNIGKHTLEEREVVSQHQVAPHPPPPRPTQRVCVPCLGWCWPLSWSL